MCNNFSCQYLDSTPTPHDHPTCLLPEPSIIKLELVQSTIRLTQSAEEPLPSRISRTPERVLEESRPPCVQSTTPDECISGKNSELSPEPSFETENPLCHQNPIKETVPPSDTADPVETAVPSCKRPIPDEDATLNDEPARKRLKTADATSHLADASPSMESSNAKPKSAVKNRRKNPITPAPPASQKRRTKYIVDSESDSDSSASPSSSQSSSVAPPPPPRLTFSDGIERDQNGISVEDSEICGMIIEGMATSRASSLPISQVYKIVMQSRPSMKAERSEKEWCVVFDHILQSGMTGRGSGVFGKVDSSYKVC